MLYGPFTRCLIYHRGKAAICPTVYRLYQIRTQDRLGIAVGIFVDKNKAPYEVGIEPTNDGYEPSAITILAIRSIAVGAFFTWERMHHPGGT